MVSRKNRRMTKALAPDKASRVLAALKKIKVDEKTSAGVARRVGISAPSMSNILSGKNGPSFELAEKVAATLGISTFELLGGVPSQSYMPTGAEYPKLAMALDLVGERCSNDARSHVTAAAAHLPDLAVATWVAMLMDPAHEKP